jgi:hypothetical protein
MHRSSEGGLGESSGEEVKIETGGFEAAEVGIQGGKRETGADGEGGEVGIHPDLGGGGGDGGEFEPECSGAFWFGIKAANREPGVPGGEDRDGVALPPRWLVR